MKLSPLRSHGMMNAMRIVRVIKDHKGEFATPLITKTGETLEGQEKETQWDGWLWCKNSAGTQGWVPKAYLEPLPKEAGRFKILKDYTAKELNVKVGEELIILLEESGWAWVRTPLGDEGWVPLENLEDLTSPSSIPDISLT